MRSGLEHVQRQAAQVHQVESVRHANALAEARDAASRQLAQLRAEHATAIAQCQEDRGEAMLRADQLASENARLVQMVATLKKHDDELYAGQQGSNAELRQLRASLASAEERIASSRMALEEESTRRLAAERRVTEWQRERPELIAQAEGRAELEAALAALQATSSAGLSQYKEDNAVLVSEVKRLKGELEAARRQVAMLEEASASTTEQLEQARKAREKEAREALGAATDEAAAALRDVDKYKKQAAEAQAALRSITSDLKEAAASEDAVDDSSTAASASAVVAVDAAAAGGSSAGGSELSCCDTASLASRKSAVSASTASEALRQLVAQRGRLRTGLKAAAEQVVQVQRKLSRATARNTQLTTQLAEMTERAEAASASARSAESARSRDESELRAERQVCQKLRAELDEHRRILASTNAQMGGLPTPRTCGRSPQQMSSSSFAVAGGGGSSPRAEGGEGGAGCAGSEGSAGGGGAAVPSEVVAEAVAEATRELATALADALTDCALETTRLEVVTRELAGAEGELDQLRLPQLNGVHGRRRGWPADGRRPRRVLVAQARPEGRRRGRGPVCRPRDRRGGASSAAAAAQAGRCTSEGGGRRRRRRRRTATMRRTRGGEDYAEEGGVSSAWAVAWGRTLGACASRAAGTSAWRTRSASPLSVPRSSNIDRASRRPSGYDGRANTRSGCVASRKREEARRVVVARRAGGRRKRRRRRRSGEMPWRRARPRGARGRAAGHGGAGGAGGRAGGQPSTRSGFRAEKEAERAAGKAREREALAQRLAADLEEAQQALERSDNEKVRLKTSLDESKRQLYQAFASADGAKRQLAKEGERCVELASEVASLAFEVERLKAALRESEDEAEIARAAASGFEARIAESAAGEAMAHEMSQESAAKASEATATAQNLEGARSELERRLAEANQEIEGLKLDLLKRADERRTFALLEAQCDSAQRAAFEAEQRANAEGSRREAAYVEVLAIGATFAVELASMDGQLARFGNLIGEMTREHERAKGKMSALEARLADADARAAAAEQEADEGALAWRGSCLRRARRTPPRLEPRRPRGGASGRRGCMRCRRSCVTR